MRERHFYNSLVTVIPILTDDPEFQVKKIEFRISIDVGAEYWKRIERLPADERREHNYLKAIEAALGRALHSVIAETLDEEPVYYATELSH